MSTAPISSFSEAFPKSTKMYLEGSRGVRVPVREIGLSGGEPPLQVYDSSGPQGFDVQTGLPPLRRAWLLARDVVEAEGRPALRLHHVPGKKPGTPQWREAGLDVESLGAARVVHLERRLASGEANFAYGNPDATGSLEIHLG